MVDDLQNASGQALQRELADLLLILRYPYVLQQLDAPAQQVESQTRESIRRSPLGIFGFQWWLKRNIIEEACPVCSYRFTGLNNSVARCPSCGEVVQIADKTFQRQAEAGTVDVAVVEVDGSGESEARVVDVQVLEAGED